MKLTGIFGAYNKLRSTELEKINQEYILECFTYHKDGSLVWRNRPRDHFSNNMGWKVFNGMYPGKVAGRIHHKGYLEVKLSGKYHCMVHRLVWIYHKGALPEFIDHINRDKLDNRIENLRAATKQENCSNRSIQKNNSVGHTGIRALPDSKYGVRINYKGETHWFGTHSTLESAISAHEKGSRELRGEFCPYYRQ